MKIAEFNTWGRWLGISCETGTVSTELGAGEVKVGTRTDMIETAGVIVLTIVMALESVNSAKCD